MRKLVVFNNVTLDGYFAGRNGDISWAHQEDAECNAFVAENASGGGVLVFGRITYDLMASYWPTPLALETMPVVAERMNNLPKVVFSRTLDQVELAYRLIRMFCFVGDTVRDPFGGTFSTALAALKANRNSIINEIDPKYFKYGESRVRAEVDNLRDLFESSPEIEIITEGAQNALRKTA